MLGLGVKEKVNKDHDFGKIMILVLIWIDKPNAIFAATDFIWLIGLAWEGHAAETLKVTNDCTNF